MAIRQYIGARYVLKIYENSLDPQSADWEAGVVYEPLVMVNYNNSSYISRKTVPANIGDPVANPSYWALSGLYNGQIAALQNQINTLDSEVDLLNTALWGDVIAVSDSYGHFPSTSDNWIERLKLMIPNTVYKAEISGAAFGDVTNSFTDVIESIESSVTDPDNVSAVVLCGGRNDFQFTDALILSGMQNFSSYVEQHYPNAKIYLFFVGMDKEITRERDLQTRVQGDYQSYTASLKNMCYVNQSELILRRYDHLIDMVHPNTSGATNIARGVKGALMVGTPLIGLQGLVLGTITHSGASDPYSNLTIKSSQIGKIINVRREAELQLNYQTAQTFLSNVEIGEISSGHIIGNDVYGCAANIPIAFRMPSVENFYQNGCAKLTFYNSKVYLSFYHPHGVDSVRIPKFNINIPTEWC